MMPIGSRRLRAARRNVNAVPFEQLPYQCFQEARKYLAEDRREKLEQIEHMEMRIANVEKQDPNISGGERAKAVRLASMRRLVQELKIYADINDPLVKKKFEDGKGMFDYLLSVRYPLTLLSPGDMNLPIYRHLADKDWRKYRRLVLMQRIQQLHIVPDVLPYADPAAEVSLYWGRNRIQPGTIVNSLMSENPCKLKIQPFDAGERLVTIAVIDSDIPNLETDQYEYRCQFMASNIPISPTKTNVPLGNLTNTQIILPWEAPTSQKGSAYHRISICVLEQPNGKAINVEELKSNVQRENFILRSFIDKQKLKPQPLGMNVFRVQWDDDMAGVMQRAGIGGWDMELKRKKVEKLPPKKRDVSRLR
jgi:large subunit ribosomal protein L35